VPIGGVFKGGHDGTVHLFGHDTFLQVANPPIGVLFLLAMSSVGVYGAMLAGWASGSKYPLLGSVRASASMISYEAALGMSVVTVILLSGSLTTHDIVLTQASGTIADWNILATAFVPFAIFCIAATAELNRPPFDFAEAEQELVAGFHTEYSSMRFGMFYLAEFMNTITMSAIIVTLFLGGPAGPIGPGPDQIWPIFWFLLKLICFLAAFVLARGTLPRFRYDQLMDLGWKRLIPLSLLWLLFIGAIRIGRDQDWNVAVVPAVAIATVLLIFGLLGGALRTAAARREEHDDELGEVAV
jgi:NADH-quinone oxidoreductase subunit H